MDVSLMDHLTTKAHGRVLMPDETLLRFAEAIIRLSSAKPEKPDDWHFNGYPGTQSRQTGNQLSASSYEAWEAEITLSLKTGQIILDHRGTRTLDPGGLALWFKTGVITPVAEENRYLPPSKRGTASPKAVKAIEKLLDLA